MFAELDDAPPATTMRAERSVIFGALVADLGMGLWAAPLDSRRCLPALGRWSPKAVAAWELQAACEDDVRTLAASLAQRLLL